MMGFSIAFIIIVLIVLYSLARTAGESDRTMEQIREQAALEEMGIYHFDSWAANFGEVTTALELTVEGSGFRFKSRFNKFTNLPELMNIFREVADVQTADMLGFQGQST